MKACRALIVLTLLAGAAFGQLSIGPGGQVSIAVGSVTGLADGNVIIGTASTPDPSVGQNGDYYVVLSTACTYGPKASGAWPGSCSAWPGGSGSTASWGSITGTLSAQTDLQTALDAKQPSITVNGIVKCNGSGTCVAAGAGTDYLAPNGNGSALTGLTESQIAGLVSDLAAKVPTSRTVNGHALSVDATISASDITTGTLPHAQLPALVSGDIPNNAANTTGTAAGLSANIAESQVTNLVTDLAGKQAAGSYEPALGNPSTNGYVLSSTTGGTRSWVASGSAQKYTILIPISGGTSPIVVGQSNISPVPSAPTDFSCTINSAKIIANASGSITVDVWKANSAIPTSANKISASAPVTLSSASINTASSLTGWTTAVSTNDIFWATVATADGVLTNATIKLGCQ